MALYRRHRRKCIECEYYLKKDDYNRAKCYFELPQIGDRYDKGSFPEVEEDDFCSHWEPKWIDNPILQDAWKEFCLVHKLVTTEEDQ